MAKKSTRSAKNKKSMLHRDALGGFTIIEVVLVLAIAGLIFMMVFIALPQLQRSQRDTQRKNDISRMQAAITNYQGANNGRLPFDDCAPPSSEDPTIQDVKDNCQNKKSGRLITDYLHGINDVRNTFVDPDGEPYKIKYEGDLAADNDNPLSAVTGMDYTVHVYTKATCDGESLKTVNSPRSYALVYRTEGSGTHCHGSSS